MPQNPLNPGPYQQAAQCWQSLADYQQTVASIMNLRGQCADTLLQASLTTCQQVAQCRTPADFIGVWGQWYSTCVSTMLELTLNTQQARAMLATSLQTQVNRTATMLQTTQTAVQVAATAPLAKATSHVTPYVTPKAETTVLTAPQPSPASVAVSTPVIPTTTTTQNATVTTVTTSMQETPSPAPTNMPLPLPTISRTGDAAVVRSGNGATIAAASAARRSVMARRQQRKSGLARAR